VLVFGSRALGVDALVPSLEDLVPPRFTVAHAKLAAERNAIDAVIKNTAPKEGILVVATEAPHDAEAARQLFEEVRRVCRTRMGGANVHGRIVIAFDEVAAAAWSRLPSRADAEGQADAALMLRKWTAPALKARLISRELLATENHLRRLLEVTGGWGMLVNAVFSQMKTDGIVQDRYEQSLEELEKELALAGSITRNEFQKAIGLDVEPRAGQLLRLISEVIGVKPEAEAQLTPDLFTGDLPGLDANELASLIELLVRLGAIDRRSGARGASDLPTTMIEIDPIVARTALA
jgi:hypothetical protein